MMKQFLLSMALAACGGVPGSTEPSATRESGAESAEAVESNESNESNASNASNAEERAGASVEGCELEQELEGHTATVDAFAYSPDGSTLATGSHDRTIKLWRLDGTELRTLEGHVHSVRALAFTEDGRELVSGGQDDSVRIWRVADGTLVHTFHGQHSSARARVPRPDWAHRGSVVAVAVRGNTIASAGNDRRVRLWNLAERAFRSEIAANTMVTSVVLADEVVAFADFEENIVVWDMGQQRIRHQLTYEPGDDASEHLVALPEGRLLSGGGDGKIREWNLQTGRLEQTWSTGQAIIVAMTRHGDTLATGHMSGDIVLSSLRTREPFARLPPHPADVTDLGFSPDGSRLVSSHYDGTTIRLWRCRVAIRSNGPI